LGYLLLQLLKEMILTLIILEKKYEKLRIGKMSNITDRVLGVDWKLDFFRAFFSKSSRTTLPQFFRIWKVAINKQLCKRK